MGDNPRRYVVSWEATVYGTTIVHATGDEDAMREAQNRVDPFRDADGHLTQLRFEEVYPE